MGIRIHKMMGYGLPDLTKKDDRLNWDSPILKRELDGPDSVAAYFRWVGEHTDPRGRALFDVAESLERADNKKDPERTKRRSIDDCFKFGSPDSGPKRTLLIKPLAWDTWYRYDDDIDYHEQTQSKKGQRDVTKVLRHGIYPYLSYMDARTGERISDEIFNWQRLRSSLERDHEIDVFTMDEYAQLAGFATSAEAEEFCVPTVPNEVRWLAEFGQLFNEPDTWIQLRPMICTWWA